MQETKDYIYNNVKLYMEKKRIYLDPTLNLAKFSQIVGTNTTQCPCPVAFRPLSLSEKESPAFLFFFFFQAA